MNMNQKVDNTETSNPESSKRGVDTKVTTPTDKASS